MAEAKKQKKKMSLVPKLIIGIVLGILIGVVCSKWEVGILKVVIRIMATFSAFFSRFLNFIIPFMVLGFVISGISNLGEGAGKLLGITAGISYGSTIIGGTLAYLMATTIFPTFIKAQTAEVSAGAKEALAPFFTIPLEPMFDVLGAIVLAFMLGLGIALLRNQDKARNTLLNVFGEFSDIITMVLGKIIIPLLPIYIAGTFANMAYTGEVFRVLSVFWKVYLLVLALHLLYLCALFIIAGAIGKKSPVMMIKNQVTPYLTAVGTQSSAATIPVNVEAARKNGVSKGIREFVIPLCATIHLAGSIITVTSCVIAVLMMNDMPYGPKLFFPFLFMLGIAMVAAPGTPGGAIMSALPFMYMVGIDASGPLGSLLIALYVTQDSFGTAANVSGDNAIAVIVDAIHDRMIAKGTAAPNPPEDDEESIA